MSSLRKAKILSDNKCRIRIKETGEHKIVDMYQLKPRYVKRLDKDGDEYTLEKQDYIVVDSDKVIGFIHSAVKCVMNDIDKQYYPNFKG